MANPRAIPGPGFTVTPDLVNHPSPEVRASQVANLALYLAWVEEILANWIVQSTSGNFAPSDASYVTVAAEGSLSKERKLVATAPLALIDGGANTTITVKTTRAPVYSDIPAGAIDGVNVIFTLANAPIAGTVRLYVNGQRFQVTTDYSIAGAVITTGEAPPAGSTILADYEKTV